MDSTQILQTVTRSTTFPDFGLPTPTESTVAGAFAAAAINEEHESEDTELSTAPGLGDTPTMEPQQSSWLPEDQQDSAQEPHPWTISSHADLDNELTQRFDEGVPSSRLIIWKTLKEKRK